jgi:hypothetical protein
MFYYVQLMFSQLLFLYFTYKDYIQHNNSNKSSGNEEDIDKEYADDFMHASSENIYGMKYFKKYNFFIFSVI